MPLVDILSVDRFSTYLLWAGGDAALGERLYSYNVQLSADFYSSLHMLEIALRNKADDALSSTYGGNWLDDQVVLCDQYQQRCVAEAKVMLRREGKVATHSQIIAELNFGFWSSLFGKSSNHIWGHTLRKIFRTQGLKRSHIAEKLRNLRRLRNRVAHYEPILAQPLVALHADVLRLASWLSVDASTWITAHSNITYPATSLILTDPATGVSVFNTTHLGYVPN
jgi:hypothetical protein